MQAPKIVKLLAALSLASATLTGTLHAHAAGDASLPKQLKSLDPDNDGTVDLGEAKKAAEAKFDALDKDHEGTLDRKELTSSLASRRAFAKADGDKDGTIDKPEYLSMVEGQFKAADPDRDGTLSAAELKSRAGKMLVNLIAQ